MKISDRYHKWVEWSEEDQVYIGKCPDLITGIHGDEPMSLYGELLYEVVEDVLNHSQSKRRPLLGATDRTHNSWGGSTSITFYANPAQNCLQDAVEFESDRCHRLHPFRYWFASSSTLCASLESIGSVSTHCCKHSSRAFSVVSSA